MVWTYYLGNFNLSNDFFQRHIKLIHENEGRKNEGSVKEKKQTTKSKSEKNKNKRVSSQAKKSKKDDRAPPEQLENTAESGLHDNTREVIILCYQYV